MNEFTSPQIGEDVAWRIARSAGAALNARRRVSAQSSGRAVHGCARLIVRSVTTSQCRPSRRLRPLFPAPSDWAIGHGRDAGGGWSRTPCFQQLCIGHRDPGTFSGQHLCNICAQFVGGGEVDPGQRVGVLLVEYLHPRGYTVRLRGIEADTLTDAEISPEGILSNRRKGSHDTSLVGQRVCARAVDWLQVYRSERMAADGRPVPIKAGERQLLFSKSGTPLTKSALDTAWQRMIKPRSLKA